MKKLIYIWLLVIAYSCNVKQALQIETNEPQELDTILLKSEESFGIISRANQRSDSIITRKVDNTVKKIVKMETEIKALKQENNELKAIINNTPTDDSKPYSLLPVSSGKNNR